MTSSKYKKINLENLIPNVPKKVTWAVFKAPEGCYYHLKMGVTGDPPGLKQSPNIISYRSYKNSSNDTFPYDLMSQLLMGL